MAALMTLKTPEMPPPNALRDVMMNTAMSARIKAYSAAAAPASSFKKDKIGFMIISRPYEDDKELTKTVVILAIPILAILRAVRGKLGSGESTQTGLSNLRLDRPVPAPLSAAAGP